jgi:RHS repeat-associated protein
VDSAPNFGWTQGEFSVSHDGSAHYSVPLWVPAGRGAVTPQLSLSYSSRSGNGLLGVGWSLGGVSAISWCGRTIAQDGYTDGGHFDGQDALCLDGNRLVPISPEGLPVREYRTERETFARIIAYETQDNVPNFFKVFTKDGKILTFGGNAEARVQPYLLIGRLLPEPSLVRMPGAPRATTAWALDRIEDRNGNAATVEYTRTEGDAAGLWWTQVRPSRISYAPNRQVRFIYQEQQRPDPIDRFSGGTHTRTDRLMSRIEMWGGPEGGEPELLRQYRFRYRLNGITFRSLLGSVTECDGGDREPEAAASTTRRCKVGLPFEYSVGRYEFEPIDVPFDEASDPREATPISVVEVNGDGRSDLNIDDRLRISMRYPGGDNFTPLKPGGVRGGQTLDVDADGLPEVLTEVNDDEHGPGYRYQLHQPVHGPPTGSRFEVVPGRLGEWRPRDGIHWPAYLADLDGDGLPDFVGTAHKADEPWSYQRNNGGYQFAKSVDAFTRRNMAFGNFAVDTDGDGRTELISAEQITGEPGWVSWGLNAAGDVVNRLVNLRGARWGVHFGDINGDGLVDAVFPNDSPDHPGELRVQLNSGNGFGSRLTADSPDGYTAPPYVISPVPQKPLTDVGVRVVDFNGDGRDDVLVFHGGEPNHGNTGKGLQVYTWTDNAFVRAELNLGIGESAGGSWENTQVLDLDGDGMLDLINADKDGRLRAFRRKGGVPDQLIRIGYGYPRGRTEIRYNTLANGADRAVHTPGTCTYPQTCPVSGGSVVAEHRVTSDFGPGYEPTWDTYGHKYEAARADLHGRGWLGFAKHTVTRAATGAKTVTEFDNETPDPDTKTYPFAQLPKKETYTVKNVNDGTGREFQSITINDYDFRPFDSGTYTVEQRSTTVTERERRVGTSTWQTLRTTKTTTSYDDFGNPDVVRSETTNGRTLTQDLDHRNNTAAWLIGLPTRTLSTGCTSTGVCTTRESTFDYDDKGNPTITVVEPNRPRLKLTTTTGYGPYGVVTSVTKTNNAGHSRTDRREYNNADQLHPTDIINAAGHRTLIETHSGLGVPLSTTDPNGVPTTFRYDRFGRLRETNRADGSFEHISHSYSTLDDRQRTTTTVAGGGETTEVVDLLGRTRERRVKTFDGHTATTYTDYDPVSQKASRTSRPALPGETPQYTVTRYDNRGRVTSVTAPDGAKVRHKYVNLETHTYDAKGVHSYTIDTVNGEVDSLNECAAPDLTGCPEDDPNSKNWLITDFGYGPFGERTRIAAPDKTSQRIHYDPLGRPDFVRVPSRGDTKTIYNAFGEVASITDAENRVTTFDEYDPLGRVKKKTSPDGVATYTWDTALHGFGKLDQATSSDGVTIAHTYDEVGRDATTTWTIEGTRYEFGYGYDDIGRRDCITYPAIPGATGPGATDRLTVGHVYNPHGYLARVTDGCQVGDPAYWTAEARNGAGQLERERLGNGVVTTRTYRPATGLLDNILTTGPGTVGKLSEIGYDYDANRNVTQRNDLAHQRFETYDYDVLNRLDSWSIQTDPAQPGMNTTYTYRPIGDLKTETVSSPNQPETTTTYRYGEHGAPEHWLTSRNSQEYRYDRTGQQISGPNRTVQYNTSGLPTVLNWGIGQGQSLRTEFAYDPDGARVLKRDDSSMPPPVPTRKPRASHVVVRGDNLWRIARDHLVAVTGRPVQQLSNREVASYWLVVVERNRHALRSRNPDLIYPGEVVGLPPLRPSPRRQVGPQRVQLPLRAASLTSHPEQTNITVAGLFERRTPAGTGGNETHNLHNIVVDGRVIAQINRSQAASGAMNPLNHVTYLHTDLQGSTVALTNHNGEPIGDDDPSLRELFYDPFGRRIDAHNEPLDDSRRGGPRQGYTGHEHDDEYGLINMKGRIYDPETRRFLTPDPIQAPVSSQTYNRYSYVQNNPATLTDPTGLLPNPPDGPGQQDPAREAAEAEGNACVENPDACFGGYSETPTTTAAPPTPSSDDDTSQPTVYVLRARFAVGSPEAIASIELFKDHPADKESLRGLLVVVGIVLLAFPVARAAVSVGRWALPVAIPAAVAAGRWVLTGVSRARAAVTAVFGAAGAAAARGDHIVLGLRRGLDLIANKLGGRTLLSDPAWRSTLRNAIADASTKFTVVLDGMRGATTYEKVYGGVTRTLTRIGGATDWEMAQLYLGQRLKDVIFVSGGSVVPNPWAP